MIYAPTAPQKLSQRVAQPISPRLPQDCQDKFLIVCCGNELQGDAAVGPRIAMAISGWKLASVRTVVVDKLTPALVLELAKTNYAIFVEPCVKSDRARTAQICPVVAPYSEPVYVEAGQCSPRKLMGLTQQIYDTCPQSWLMKVPTQDFRFSRRLSSTAITGINQALKTITQFLRIYQSPQGQSPQGQSLQE